MQMQCSVTAVSFPVLPNITHVRMGFANVKAEIVGNMTKDKI
jgi:hypothetical protein